jgi:hypothetical protein
MIRKDISRSHKVAGLSPKALALFGMLLPHYNVHGKMDANPHTVKGTIVPFIDWFDIPTITKCLHEISDKTNVKYFQVDGCWYLHSLNYDEHQEIRRKGRDYLPSYPGPVPDKSGSSTGEVPPEVEPEVEVEPELEVEPEPEVKSVAPDGAAPTKRFVKPTLEQVAAYCTERKTGIDPQLFIDSNDAKGWVVGTTKTPMKDWKATIRTWEKRNGSGTETQYGQRIGDGKVKATPGKYARIGTVIGTGAGGVGEAGKTPETTGTAEEDKPRRSANALP